MRRIAFAAAFAIALIWFVYRIAFVYTIRTGVCTAENTPSPPAAAGRVPDLVVLTWNAEGHAALFDPNHVAELAAVVLRHDPDVVGLQEIHRATWQARGIDQASELAARTGRHAFFGRSFAAGEGEFGNAILTRAPVRYAVTHPLPSVGEPRSLLEAWIETGSGMVRVFVTHLAAWGALRRVSRSEQLECVAAHLRATDVPRILMGDLNAGPPELEAFRREVGLLQADPGVATHRLTRRQLDYVFADRAWRVVSSRVLHEGPSDHWPILVRLAPAAEGIQ